MHEVSIASAILDAVRAEGGRHPGSRFCKVGVRIGEWSGVEPEALRFCFEVLVKGTDLAALQLELETCSRRLLCLQCGRMSLAKEHGWACPACGSSDTKPIGGDELELAFLEVEDHDTPADGAQGPQ